MTRRNRVRPPTRPDHMPPKRAKGQTGIPMKDDKGELVEKMKARISAKYIY